MRGNLTKILDGMDNSVGRKKRPDGVYERRNGTGTTIGGYILQPVRISTQRPLQFSFIGEMSDFKIFPEKLDAFNLS